MFHRRKKLAMNTDLVGKNCKHHYSSDLNKVMNEMGGISLYLIFFVLNWIRFQPLHYAK